MLLQKRTSEALGLAEQHRRLVPRFGLGFYALWAAVPVAELSIDLKPCSLHATQCPCPPILAVFRALHKALGM